MDIITIDPSLSCTAMCINNQFFVYASKNIAHTKTGKLTNWFSKLEPYITCRVHEPINRDLGHTESEISKLLAFNEIVANILMDIRLNKTERSSIICIEGYSYSSATQSLIDLVTFSTLLKLKLLTELPETKLIILPPSTVKVRACELVYGIEYSSKGKKLSSRNNDGISGGKFTKKEIMQSLLDYNKKDWYIDVLKKDELMEATKLSLIPKPLEDVNDAKIIFEIVLDKLKNTNYDLHEIENKLM